MALDKVVDSTILDGYFSDIADAIRDKNGESGQYSPAQMPDKIAAIPTMSQALLDLLTYQANGEVELSGIEDLGYLQIHLGDAIGSNRVTKLSSQDLKYLYDNYPYNSFATSGGLYCGTSGASLEEINLPNCEKIKLGARNIYYWQNLRTIKLPKVKIISGRITSTYLTTLDFPELITLETNNAFNGNTAVTTVNMPKLETTGTGTFQGCSALTHIELPCLVSVKSQMFQKCAALSTVDIGGDGGSIENVTFRYCNNLTAVIFRSTTLKSLTNANAFLDSSIAAGTGYIYVPRDLISAYQNATNWSTYASQFRAIEDLPA